MEANKTPERGKTPLGDWIVQNLDSIRNGTGVYEGQRITVDTELVRFHTCYSMVFLFMRQPSPLFLKDSPEAMKAGSIATVATFLLGWWSIHGIIYTPITLVRNMLQSDKTTIAQMIERAENPPKTPAWQRIMAVGFLILVAAVFIWAGFQSKSH